MKGKIWMARDFEQPLEDFAEYMTTAKEGAAGIKDAWKKKRRSSPIPMFGSGFPGEERSKLSRDGD